MRRTPGTVCALLRIVLALWALSIASDYVAQSRYESVAARPCDAGLCGLFRDTRDNSFFWQVIPPAPSKDIITGTYRSNRTRIALDAMVES